MPDLVIKINGDVEDFQAGLELAREGTESLSDSLQTTATYATVAFAALSAQIIGSVKAFSDQEESINAVNNSLQNQGLFTQDLADSYRETAEAIQAKTGVDADSISQGQAVAQSLMGQKVITQQLSEAIVDFAQHQKIDVVQAFNLVGKAVGTGSNMLQRYGIDIKAAATSQERLDDVTQQLSQRFAGSAEQMANTTGSTVLLTRAFVDLEKAIGEQLAPAFDAVVASLTEFFNYLKDSPELIKFIADATLAATVVAGLVASLALAATAFLQISSVLTALGIVAGVSVGWIAAIAVAIAGLVVVGLELYQHWSTIWPAAQAIFKDFVDYVVNSSKALGLILEGALTFNPAKIKAGLDELAQEYTSAYAKIASTITGAMSEQTKVQNDEGQKQIADKKVNADKAQAIQDNIDAANAQKNQASNELIALQNQNASKEYIDMKKQEIQILTQMANEKKGALYDELVQELAQNRKLQADESVVEVERQAEVNGQLLEGNRAYQEMSISQRQLFLQQYQQTLEKGLIVEQNALSQSALKDAQIQAKADNQFQLDRVKFGKTFATINEGIHSQEFEAASDAANQLQGLAKSNNSTLKAIGQVAAVSTIAIATATSAAKVFADAVILLGPFAGPPVGGALAAARIAYGAEQIANVYAAADGGLLQGGTPGVDSIPVLAQQGELVSPAQNFEEVIGSVAATRAAADVGGSIGGGDNSAQMLQILQDIDNKIGATGNQNIVVNGDVIGDPAWVQAFVTALSNALEFKNAKVFGVSTGKSLL